jgi:hypothetical protein
MATAGEIAREVINLVPNTPYLVCARKWVNARYSELLSLHPSHLRENLGEVIIPGTYTTGTVAATRGSATVTGTGTTFAAAHASRYIKISGNWHLISTQDSATQLTLTNNFSEATVTASAFIIAPRLTTVVADARRFTGFTLARTNQRLDELSPQQFTRLYPQPVATGTPEYIIFHGVDSNNDHTVEVYPYPTNDELITFTYYAGPPTLTESTSIPDLLDPYILREGALIDAYTYAANAAAQRNQIDTAAYFSNKSAQQRTVWQRLMRAAILDTTPTDHGALLSRPLHNLRNSRPHHRNLIENV